MKKEMISPLGFDNARELTNEEIDIVGGAAAKQTFHVKVTNPQDAEAQYDIEW